MREASPPARPRIAVFAGPTATILNSEPLVTSNKARAARGMPERSAPDGRPLRYDPLRPQRLASPVTVYVEQFSAHPLEADAAALYGPPDGYLDATGAFHVERTDPTQVPVLRLELRPEDGLYPLPYAAFQADGRPWEGDEAEPFGPREAARQPFYPDASRLFEEIDRLHPGGDGLAGHLDRLADYEFFRAAPPGGPMTQGEQPGEDFFPYRPPHLLRQPSRRTLARLTNSVARTLATGAFDGALWLEGSPFVEETAYWLGLLIDTDRPIAAASAQRPHGSLGSDGDRNIVDAVRYLASGVWADDAGRDALGSVVVVDQLIHAARSVQKADARPGGYVGTGGHGGVLGSVANGGEVVVSWRPVRSSTWRSAVRLSQLPESTQAAGRGPGGPKAHAIAVRAPDGSLDPDAIPAVEIVKQAQYREPDERVDPRREVGLAATVETMLAGGRLAGIVAEGAAPFGTMSESVEAALRLAVLSGIPVVKVGRGNADGVGEHRYNPLAITGGNLSASKARLLLMASLLRLGSLPAAPDPGAATPDEIRSIRKALDAYQEIFDRH